MANNSINWLGNQVIGENLNNNSNGMEPLNQFNSAVDSTVDYSRVIERDDDNQQGPPPISTVGYIPYYLKTNIGKNIRAEFSIGSNLYLDKVGKLIEVGVNYFVLYDENFRTNVMCDLYSVRFVTILP